MTKAAMPPARNHCWFGMPSTATGCIAAGLFLIMTMDNVGAQYIGNVSDRTVPATEEIKSGLDAIPTDIPVHASSPSPINQPFSLLPGTIRTEPVLLEDTERPSLAEQYRMEKQGIKRAPSQATVVKRATKTKPAPIVMAKPAPVETVSTADTPQPAISATVPESGPSQTAAITGSSMFPPATDNAFAIQLGAFHDTISAQTYWASFMIRYPDLAKSHQRSLSTADLGPKGIFHRLRLGGFNDMASAETKCRQLLADGTDCFATRDQ
ncbi:SPOR domain-containing protein [Thalassospira xianhensis]|uniref:SPOR domain-containing protein n=1 Tax=Thalassospira xianhensis MCCC 1A02616 TaxID=1177929 RepID=A0A367UBC7_9PROT|nr:SPOR domain-containing protein [Thalassospira xianhensis]RCK04584.1 hypothetical protein TH5_18915 [Thalassospira xianhensis MCCC 1A02616]